MQFTENEYTSHTQTTIHNCQLNSQDASWEYPLKTNPNGSQSFAKKEQQCQ